MGEFNPRRMVELVQEAESAHQKGLLDKAESLYQEVLAFERDAFRSGALKGPDGAKVKTYLNTTFSRIYNNLASIRAGEKNYRDAADLLRAALDYAPGSLEVLTNAALVNLRQGNFEKAISFSREALENQPDHVPAATQFAKAALETGQIEEALKRCEQASRKGEKNVSFLVAWGQALVQAGRSADAREKFLTAHKANPEAPFPLVLAGTASVRLGEFEEGISYFDRALRRDPVNLLAHASLATLYLQLNRFNEAEKHFKAALKINPEHPDTIGNYAIFLFQKGHYKEAARLVTDVMESADITEHLRITSGITLSRSLRRLGRFEEAASRLQQLVQLAPSVTEHPAYHKERGFLLEAEGKYSDAFREYEKGNVVFAKMAPTFPPKGFDVDKVIEATLSEDFTAHTFGTKGEAPVFIVGFLLGGAQVLSALLSGFAPLKVLEDSTAINGIRMRLAKEDEPYPAILNLLSDSVVEDLRSHYQKLFFENDGANPKRLNVNAYPLNLLDVPLILKLYPRVRFIYCCNHPYDAALNCFFKDHPPNPTTRKFADLGEIGTLYADCMKLWEKFKKELPLTYRFVRSEDLLKAPQKELGPLLEFIDPEGQYNLSSSEGALAKLDDIAAGQKTLYTPGRWRNYAELLGPLPKKLNSACKTLGYPTE